MKKFAALILALILALAAALPAQAEESWYEITDGVLTIRLDTAPGCSWDFMIDDLYYLDVVTFEYLGDEPGEVEEGAPIQFVGSFTNFSGESGSTTLNLVYSNENSEEITFFAINVTVDESGVTGLSYVRAVPRAEIQSYADLPAPLMLVKNITAEGIEFVTGYMDVSQGEEMAAFTPYNSAPSFLPVAEGAIFRLPGDMYEPMVLSEIEDYYAWYEDICQSLGFTYEFFAVIDTDSAGITGLEYVYVP